MVARSTEYVLQLRAPAQPVRPPATTERRPAEQPEPGPVRVSTAGQMWHVRKRTRHAYANIRRLNTTAAYEIGSANVRQIFEPDGRSTLFRRHIALGTRTTDVTHVGIETESPLNERFNARKDVRKENACLRFCNPMKNRARISQKNPLLGGFF